MYLELVSWMQAISELILAQQALGQEAVVVSRYETIMEDLKRLDRDLFEFANMLARSNKDGKIDLMELATFASMYAPKESAREMSEGMETTVKPIAERAKSIGQTLRFPKRVRIPLIKRAYEEMQEATEQWRRGC